jgi:flagellar biosynthesis protein FlhB
MYMKVFLIALCMVVAPIASFAAHGGGHEPAPNPTTGGIEDIEIEFTNPIGGNGSVAGIDSLTELIEAILQIVITFGIPLVVLAIIYTGFLFVSAMGDKAKIEDARKAFTWVVVGAIIILSSFVIAEAIDGTIQQIINAE